MSLGIYTVDKLHPNLSNLLDSLNNVSLLPVDFEPKKRICKWLLTINSKPSISDELNEEEIKNLSFDLESGLRTFMNLLNKL